MVSQEESTRIDQLASDIYTVCYRAQYYRERLPSLRASIIVFGWSMLFGGLCSLAVKSVMECTLICTAAIWIISAIITDEFITLLLNRIKLAYELPMLDGPTSERLHVFNPQKLEKLGHHLRATEYSMIRINVITAMHKKSDLNDRELMEYILMRLAHHDWNPDRCKNPILNNVPFH